jgi:uracil-DNA glycosylase
LCCRPLDEDGKIRKPTKQESLTCSPRLQATIELANPRGIVLLGQTAKTLYKMLRGLPPLPLLELQHPAYLLRKGGKASLEYDRALILLSDFVRTNGKKKTKTVCPF